MSSASHAVEPERGRRISLFWPERILGPRPGLKEMNLVCWVAFLAFLLVPLCVLQWRQVKRGNGSVTQLHSDFVYFYGDGEIAREYPAARIYDYALQLQTFNAIYPAHGGVYGPSPYPPYVPLFFEPYAHLSFQTAYVVWMCVSLALYLIGIGAAALAVFPGERLKISIVLCLALAFDPFLFGTLVNGQLASIAVCAVGLAVYQERHGNLFWSGLALALLTYKPTLLLLVLPMLLLTRRFRTLLGFITGTAVLVLLSMAFAGMQIWPAYLHMLHDFGRIAGLGGASRMTLWNHVDLKSCFAAIPGGKSPVASAILMCISGVSAIALLVLLWKSVAGGRPAHWLAWSAALTWTLLVNVYIPIYDSVLVVIAMVLMIGALRDLAWHDVMEWTTFFAILMLAVSWKTETIAKAHGIQLFTVMLVILGLAQLLLLYLASRHRAPELAP
jgi:Glycosyltransferase family 87